MYTLSTLPREILYIIATFLDIQDLVTVARLNNWYGYWLSCILSERMKELVEKEGWRIHVSIHIEKEKRRKYQRIHRLTYWLLHIHQLKITHLQLYAKQNSYY